MINIDKTKFDNLFFIERKSLRDIAREFNCHTITLQRFIKKHKLNREPLTLIEDISGKRFNKLIAIKYLYNDKFGKAIWLMKCDCGKETKINAASAKRGLTKSCGCFKSARLRKNSVGLLSHGFWNKLQRSALSRNYDFTITEEEAWEKFIEQNGKCAISGVVITLNTNSNKERLQTASPDRIDSTKGYTKDNFQWVHKRINRIKNILSNDELIFWARKIVENNISSTNIDINVNNVTWD